MGVSVGCLMCERAIDLAEVVDRGIDDLPDPFVVRCPHCQSQELVAKSEVRANEISSSLS